MKLEPFCGWGDGPDVGINIELPFNRVLWQPGSPLWTIKTQETALICVDLTAKEARDLAAELVSKAEAAEFLEQSLKEYEVTAPTLDP